MGCCVSKCKPNTKLDFKPRIQDKLVISQSPTQNLETTSDSLSYSTQSTCGLSSLSSASSSASSVAFSKVDRSFSNEFLQSCAMENLHIVGLNPTKKEREVKELSQGNSKKRARVASGIFLSPVVAAAPAGSHIGQPMRATSPNLTRQKSFRNNMRSPSPSNYRRQTTLSRNTENPNNHRMEKTKMRRPSSPNCNVTSNERHVYVNKNKDHFGYKVCSNVEKVKVGQVLSKVNYSGSNLGIEDLDNPHIALDCFIFL